MAQRTDAKLPQVLRRKVRQDGLVNRPDTSYLGFATCPVDGAAHLLRASPPRPGLDRAYGTQAAGPCELVAYFMRSVDQREGGNVRQNRTASAGQNCS